MASFKQIFILAPLHYRKDARLQLPVYLDDPVQAQLAALAEAKGVELSALVNDLLRKDIELVEVAR